jgi:hypothetical protein
MRSAGIRVALLAAALGIALGCGERARERERERARLAHRDTALVLGPGDVQIVNTDSTVEMALIGQNIVVRLSDKIMARVRHDIDTSALRDSGIGSSIERLVKSTVASALNQQLQYPLSEVREARYENGAIKLDVSGRQPRAFSSTKVGGRPLMETFRPDDAQRFVNAVNARKRG